MGHNFSYYFEADTIDYDLEVAEGKLHECGNKLYTCYNNLVKLVDSFENMQKYVNDKDGTYVANDYKDLETVVGDNSAGVNGFLHDLDVTLEEFYEYFNELKQISYRQ